MLGPGGVAMFVTPNRLTFGRPDEIIDPYHHVEFDEQELRALCEGGFGEVTMAGLFGSDRYAELQREEKAKLDSLLRKDPLRLRRLVPRALKMRLYDRRLRAERLGKDDPRASAIGVEDFQVRQDGLEGCLDLIAVCSKPRT